jgi:hypothetical protein
MKLSNLEAGNRFGVREWAAVVGEHGGSAAGARRAVVAAVDAHG